MNFSALAIDLKNGDRIIASHIEYTATFLKVHNLDGPPRMLDLGEIRQILPATHHVRQDGAQRVLPPNCTMLITIETTNKGYAATIVDMHGGGASPEKYLAAFGVKHRHELATGWRALKSLAENMERAGCLD